MSSHWMTCTHCGEKRNASGDYTSPANREKDNWDWEKQHAYGACLKIRESEVISTDTHIYNANRKIAAAEQDLKEAKELLKKAQEKEKEQRESMEGFRVGTPVIRIADSVLGQVQEMGAVLVMVRWMDSYVSWYSPNALQRLEPVKPRGTFKEGAKVRRINTSIHSGFNGRIGYLIRRSSEPGEWIVTFPKYGTVRIEEANLELVD